MHSIVQRQSCLRQLSTSTNSVCCSAFTGVYVILNTFSVGLGTWVFASVFSIICQVCNVKGTVSMTQPNHRLNNETQCLLWLAVNLFYCHFSHYVPYINV